MSKPLTVEIRLLSGLVDDLRGAFKAMQQRRSFRWRERVYFTSLKPVLNFLTRERLNLQAIRTKQSRSIYESAKAEDRDLKNVQQAVRLLERHGLVRLAERRRGQKSKAKVPEAPSDQIALRIAI
jgi:predicted transcriptional regulator